MNILSIRVNLGPFGRLQGWLEEGSAVWWRQFPHHCMLDNEHLTPPRMLQFFNKRTGIPVQTPEGGLMEDLPRPFHWP